MIFSSKTRSTIPGTIVPGCEISTDNVAVPVLGERSRESRKVRFHVFQPDVIGGVGCAWLDRVSRSRIRSERQRGDIRRQHEYKAGRGGSRPRGRDEDHNVCFRCGHSLHDLLCGVEELPGSVDRNDKQGRPIPVRPIDRRDEIFRRERMDHAVQRDRVDRRMAVPPSAGTFRS